MSRLSGIMNGFARYSLFGLLWVVGTSVSAWPGEDVTPFKAASSDVNIISLRGTWRFKRDFSVKTGRGEARDGWETAAFDDTNWATLEVGKSWESQGQNFNGVGWYRTKVIIPAEWKGEDLFLICGRPDDAAETYLNGTSLGRTGKFGDWIDYRLPSEMVKYGEANTIAIRVWDWYKGGGLSSGDYLIVRAGPLSQKTNPGAADTQPMRLSVGESLTDDVMSGERWKWGWRDAGTSDTRPKMSAAQGAFNGSDAIAMNVWYPNSSGETVDYTLKPEEQGAVWKERGYEYISFWYKTEDTAGEMVLNLNKGHVVWGNRGTLSYNTKFFVRPGGWHRVILPFTAFRKGKREKAEELTDPTPINTIAIGQRNNMLEKPGTVLFAEFEVGRFKIAPEGRPIDLASYWRFKLDNQHPDGTPLDKEKEDEKEGLGLSQGWHTAAYDDSDWTVLRAGASWESQGHSYDGVAWYRQRVWIPEDWRGMPLHLNMGKPDDRGEVYFNGTMVAEVKKFGPSFEIDLQQEQIKYGEPNLIAVRIADWYQGGGIQGSPYIGPRTERFTMRFSGESPEQEKAPGAFEMGPRPPEQPIEYVMRFFKGLSQETDLVADYRLVDCFHRTIATGMVPVKPGPDGALQAVVALDKDETRQLYYGEWFDVRGLLRSEAKGPIRAFSEYDNKLLYEGRDNLSLPPLPETYEKTPYGRLKLIDVIDCAANPDTDVHPYKEGGIRASWVGRRAYSTWKRGITVGEYKGRKFREANNNEFFGYRLGRGTMKPHQAYLVRILYPEDKSRYAPIEFKMGRNYQGTGFRTGLGPDNPVDNYPLSGEYQWYDNLVMNDDVTYGYQGSRDSSSENGFWVIFHDNGRSYTGQYDAGPAVSEIRVYEMADIEKHYPVIRYPEGLPKRRLMMDWEREPEAPPYDVARYARFMGLNAVAPVFQKWAFMAYYDTTMNWDVPKPDAWNSAVRPDERNEDLYKNWLNGTKKAGIEIIPRLEYGGSKGLPKEAWVISPSGKIAGAGRYAWWGANLLHPKTEEEMKRLFDEIVADRHDTYGHIAGVLWRMRNDRLKCSYGKRDVEMFCAETGRDMPKGDAKAIAQWAYKTVGDAYHAWWHAKRRDFHARLVEYLKNIDPSLVLYYYNWDADGWNLGPSYNESNKPEDWSDLYNVNRASLFHQRKIEARKKYTGEDYVKMLQNFGDQHKIVYPNLYKDMKDFVLFAPVHWRYLADNEPYINYFNTGDGLGICNMFRYEEKGRWNLQGDNYESSEMTPAGPAFGMAEEVLSCFHGDPNVITWTTYTYGRGFINTHRRFAQAFLALPDMRGTLLGKEAVSPANADVRVRTYATDNGTYVGVVHRGMTPATFTIRIPVPGANVIDLVTGKTVETKREGETIIFTIESGAMQLNSYLVK